MKKHYNKVCKHCGRNFKTSWKRKINCSLRCSRAYPKSIVYRNKNKKLQKEWRERPEVKERIRLQRQSPERKRKAKLYYQRPEVKERIRLYHLKYNAQKKQNNKNGS